MDAFDVAILGNGIAANMVARDLLLRRPDLRVAVVGPAAPRRYAVGESVTEGAAHYLQHRLQLTSYLYRHHLPKFGIRWLYTDEHRSLPLTEHTEDGTGQPPVFNTFHLDRFRIEEDLKSMNAASGAVFVDSQAERLETGPEWHVLDGRLRARWLLDATGRQRFLARRLDLTAPLAEGFHSSAWGHFPGRYRIDEQSKEWRRRNLFTSREFSTIHFPLEHGWIWVIPLADGTVSCGVVYDSRHLFPTGAPGREEFVAFLRSHRGLSETFEIGEPVSFGAAERYSYGCPEVLSVAGRHLLLGDAGGFVDPLYSPGLELLAETCEVAVPFVLDHLDGAVPEAALGSRAARLNHMVKAGYRYYELLVLGNSAGLGSADLNTLKYFFDFALYYAGRLWLFLAEALQSPGDPGALQKRLEADLERVALVARNFRPLAARARARGWYHRRNRGFRTFSLGGIHVAPDMARPLTPAMQQKRLDFVQDLYEFVLLRQAELWFERTDLRGHGRLAGWLSPSRVQDLAARAGGEPEVLFREVGAWLAAEDALPDREFWPGWLRRRAEGHATRSSGRDFSAFLPAMLRDDRPEEARPTVAEPRIARIVSRFERARRRPDPGSSDPFEVEASAAGLVEAGLPLAEVLSRFPDAFRTVVLTGCGMGAARTVPDLAALREEDWPAFLDGLGFALAQGALREGREAVFPGSPRRRWLVAGMGRAVTFDPMRSNDPEKYDRAFRVLGLFPGDREAFYRGAGFSLAFTGTLAEDHPLLRGPEAGQTTRGAQEATALRATLQTTGAL